MPQLSKQTLARKQCILSGIGCSLFIAPNPAASGDAPWYELAWQSQVAQYDAIINLVALQTNVDGRLIRAIMFMETTHGYYDKPLALFNLNHSIQPMNINLDVWGDAFSGRATLKCPYYNILAGATILRGIKANLPAGAPVSHIATLYNNINASQVSSYGLRVEQIYQSQPWLKK